MTDEDERRLARLQRIQREIVEYLEEILCDDPKPEQEPKKED